MEGQINNQLLVEISQAFLHEINNGNRTLVKNGKLCLEKISETQYTINIQNFQYNFTSDTGIFFKVTNGIYSSYLFTQNKENLYAITLNKYQGASEFQMHINKSTEIYSFEKAKNYHLFQKLIEQNYPNPNVPIIESTNANRIIQKCGSIIGQSFKVIGGWSASAVNYVGEFIQSKVSEGQLSEVNKQKIETVTQKSKTVSNAVLDVANKISKPLIETGTNLGNKLSSSLQSSQNSHVRKLGDIGTTSLHAGKIAWKGFWNGLCTFGSALKTQSLNIWNKRFYSAQPLNEQSAIAPQKQQVSTQQKTQTPIN